MLMTKTVLRKLCCGALAAALALCLGGCGLERSIYANYRALEELRTVRAMGLDREPDGALTITVAADAAEGSDQPTVLSHSGSSILPTLELLQDDTGQGQLFFAHTQYLVLGQAEAEAGLGPVLDYFERDVHTRLGTALFVLREGSARTLFESLEDSEHVSALLASIQRDTRLRGDSHVSNLRETAVALSEYGAAAVCALSLTDGDGAAAVPDGYAILRGGMLAGFLSGNEARALSLLNGTLGTVARTETPDDAGSVSFALSGGAADYSLQRTAAGTPRLSVRVNVDAAAAAADGGGMPDEEALARFRAELTGQLREEIARVLDYARTLDADFLGLAGVLRRAGSGALTQTPGWLQTLEFDIAVNCTVTHSYELGRPLPMDGGSA